MTDLLLAASLLALFNAARGRAEISHGHWLVMVWLITASPFVLYCAVVVTTIRTRYLLDAANGDVNGIWKGLLRNSLILPALYVSGHWLGIIMMLQPFVYFECGKLFKQNEVRYAEFITGAMLALLIYA